MIIKKRQEKKKKNEQQKKNEKIQREKAGIEGQKQKQTKKI